MKSSGATILSVLTDVSKVEDVEALAQKTLDTFGEVHLLCNNAGVGAGGLLWENTMSDWKWVMGVNLWGVIHGIVKLHKLPEVIIVFQTIMEWS